MFVNISFFQSSLAQLLCLSYLAKKKINWALCIWLSYIINHYEKRQSDRFSLTSFALDYIWLNIKYDGKYIHIYKIFSILVSFF